MGMNPPPLDRAIPCWGFWRDPMLATLTVYRQERGFGESVPDEVLSIAPTLFSRGFHPQTAVRLVLHGLGRYALKTKPEDWPNWPVQMDWFRQWPTEEDGRRRR
jgi:hypothetical protein